MAYRDRRVVQLACDESKERDRWRASLRIYGLGRPHNLHGYGSNIPLALVALSRSIERFAAEQFANLLDPPPAEAPVLAEALPAASAPKLCVGCGLTPVERGGWCGTCADIEDRETGGSG